MKIENQILSIYCGVNGFLDDIPIEHIHTFERELHAFMDRSQLFEEKKRSLRYNLDRDSLNQLLRNFTNHFKNRLLAEESK